MPKRIIKRRVFHLGKKKRSNAIFERLKWLFYVVCVSTHTKNTIMKRETDVRWWEHSSPPPPGVLQFMELHESQKSDMIEWLNWTELKTSLDLPLWPATPQLGKGLRNQNTIVELKTTKEKKDWEEVLEMLELNRGQSRLQKSHFFCPYSFHGFWDDLHQAWNSHSEGNPMQHHEWSYCESYQWAQDSYFSPSLSPLIGSPRTSSFTIY